MYSEDDMLMLSGIQHYRFCPRQWALIHLEQQWDDNRLTIEGQLLHKHVDDPFYRQKCGDHITLRSVHVASRELGLYGISDAVESKFMRCDINRAEGDVVATFLTIERVVNMLVQQLSFNRQPIVVPLLLKMYESPLPEAEPVVLYPRQHQHIVFAIHILYKLFHRHIRRNTCLINRHRIIAERTGSPITCFLYLNQLE